MDSSTIELNGSQIASVTQSADQVRIHFSRATLIKTMTGSAERTRWWQAGDLVLSGATLQSPLPEGARLCTGGEIEDNIYTYRNMLPIPLDSQGHARCVLLFEDDASLIVEARAIRLELHETAHYIEHIRP
ncbi:MAG: hypothetical protein JXM75_06250 [Chromatiaceae bacterium]|nr:hypothetical protein [Chromatiaceae bacterium]